MAVTVDVGDGRVPPAARAFHALCAAAGATGTRVQASTGTGSRPQPPVGVCGVCGGGYRLREDGMVRAHNAPRDRCPGSGGPAGSGVCPVCLARVRPGRAGDAPAHRPPAARCAGGEGTPASVATPPDLPPVEAVSVQAPLPGGRYAVGVWHDGAYSAGFVLAPYANGCGSGPQAVGVRALEGHVRAAR
jgi:hypothetical protein